MNEHERLEEFADELECAINGLRDAHDMAAAIVADMDSDIPKSRERFIRNIMDDIRRFDNAIDDDFLDNPCGFVPEE